MLARGKWSSMRSEPWYARLLFILVLSGMIPCICRWARRWSEHPGCPHPIILSCTRGPSCQVSVPSGVAVVLEARRHPYTEHSTDDRITVEPARRIRYCPGGSTMEPVKYCIECGKPLPPESKHCPNCGADVTDLHPTLSDDVQEATPAPLTQEPPPQPAQAAPYGGPGAAPRSPSDSASAYSKATAAPGLQRTRGATSPKRLGGGFIAILGGVAMLVAQGFSVSKGNSLDLLRVGLGLLCLVSGVVALVVRGWGWVI